VPATPAPAKVQIVASVVAECPFRAKSARANWYAFVKAHEGKPVTELLAAHAANPVSYHIRGKRAGQPEDGAEWLEWLAKPEQKVIVLGYRKA
jgi:hypothetical protein